MKKQLFILTILLSTQFALQAQSPDYEWAKSAMGTNQDYSQSVTVDVDGNVLITGYFESPNITFGSTILSNSMINQTSDIFLAKYDASGNVIWAKSIWGTDDDFSYSVTTDATGNILIAGYFTSDSISFDSITLFNNGAQNMFLAKYDPSGNLLWAKSASGTYTNVIAKSVAVDQSSNGDIFITGYYSTNTLILDSISTSGNGTIQMFVAKYNSNGNAIWARSSYGGFYVLASSVSVEDNSGDILVSGYYWSSTVLFGTTVLTNVSTITSNAYDVFLVKYDSNGNVIWAKSSGGNKAD